jgi:hypothetical protein
MEFPLHKNPKKLVDFFGIVQKEQVPDKVNKEFLHVHKFASSYDEAIPKILVQLDFVNSARIPSEKWRRYRDASQSKRVMGEAIRIAYAELFKVYSNPLEKSRVDLSNFFKGKTELDEKNVNYVITTFEQLCSMASFNQNGELPSSTITDDPSNHPPDIEVPLQQQRPPIKTGCGTNQYTVNLNIELQLPETTNPDVYDKLFESMKKHLFS